MKRRIGFLLLFLVLVVIAIPAFAAKALKHVAHSY
jgi:hypothetical protein